MRNLFLSVILLLAAATQSWAAVGCDLNDPDRDVARLFAGSTSYKTVYLSIQQKGGEALLSKIEEQLGDKFRGLYETIDVPYTLYEIYQGKQKIGYIHGVNQKGQYGGLQVFLALDLEGNIKSFYYQKLTSKYGKQFRDPKFGQQFVGLSLKDFYNYDVLSGKTTGPGKVEEIKNPVPEAESDFRVSLRAIKKDLILMDEFIYGNMYHKYFKPSGAVTK